MGPGGYLDAELLDGRRGLVPAHFVQRLIGTLKTETISVKKRKKTNLVKLTSFKLKSQYKTDVITITTIANMTMFQGDDLLEFHQAVLSTLREEEINQENFAADVARLNELAEMAEQQEDENTGPEGETGRIILHVLESLSCSLVSVVMVFLLCIVRRLTEEFASSSPKIP